MLWAIPVLLFVSAVGAQTRLNSFIESGLALAKREQAEQRRSRPEELRQIFWRHFGEAVERLETGRSTDAQLAEIYDALTAIIASPEDKRLASLLVTVVDELHSRNASTAMIREAPFLNHPAEYAYDVLVSAHLFEIAREVASAYPAVVEQFEYQVIEDEQNPVSGPAVLKQLPSATKKVLAAEQINLASGQWLVGIVHPGCPYSRDAMAWIDANWSEIEALFPEQTLWMTSQLELSKYNRISEGVYPGSDRMQIRIAYRNDAWPREIMITYTPTFHLVEDGEVIATVNGWSNDESPTELIELLKR